MNVSYEDQFKLSNSIRDVRRRLTEICEAISDKKYEGELEGGLLIAFGDYFQGLPLARQMGTNPFKDIALYVHDEEFQKTLEDLMQPSSPDHDGAVIVDRTGQVLGARIYLDVTYPDVLIDENCGTRHIAAASYSMEPATICTFTVSETNAKTRVYFDGQRKHLYNPEDKNNKKED